MILFCCCIFQHCFLNEKGLANASPFGISDITLV